MPPTDLVRLAEGPNTGIQYVYHVRLHMPGHGHRRLAHAKHRKGCKCACCRNGRHDPNTRRHNAPMQNMKPLFVQAPGHVLGIGQGHRQPVIDFALTELICLGLSLALSVCLLLVGYKLGSVVCRYEIARDPRFSHGRGHKGSLARRGVPITTVSKEELDLDDESEISPLLSISSQLA